MGEFLSLFFLIPIGVQGSVRPLQQMQGLNLILSYCLSLISFVDLFNAAEAGMSVFSPLAACGVLSAVMADFI